MWGVCTAAFSVCRSLREGYLFWAVNGIGLALVIPTSQSLIADYYQASILDLYAMTFERSANSTDLVLWAVNGIGVALAIPTSQELIADYYHAIRIGLYYLYEGAHMLTWLSGQSMT